MAKEEKGRAFLTTTEGWSLHPQGAYALWRFCHRLATDGYVKSNRQTELLERAKNVRDGHGFFTAKELRAMEELEEAKELLS